ncbi:MAG: hypothetical protein HQL73_09220 [Magnetococcales bacterium]|nr:hypothetical protein [Magnetococcales bacterium]
MNFRKRRASTGLPMVLLALLLTGCGGPEGIEVTPELIAGDSLWDTGKRMLFPSAYWHDKAAQFSKLVIDERQRYREASQAYHQALLARRQEILQSTDLNSKEDQSSTQVRREVIQRYRDRLNPLRESSRQYGRAVNQATVLMQKARRNLEIALTR